MTDRDGELSDLERKTLAALPREASPPASLEQATVNALIARGLVHRARPMRGRLLRVALAAAAGIVVFLGGLTVGRVRSAAADERPEFILLLYEGPEYRLPARGQEEQRVHEYGAWARLKDRPGEVVEGEKLRDEPDAMIRGDGTLTATNEPTRLTGFFLIRANNRDAALEVARTCPHLRYGGSILVREIEPT